MCSAWLLVDLFTKDFAYELQIYKKRANWQAWVALQLARIIVLLFIAHLAPGGNTLSISLISISNGGGAFPYHYPTLFHKTRLLKMPRRGTRRPH